jgi:ketosteroid isomerase-like protein
MRDRAEPPVILTWEPVAARVSADGLLGYTTGPWTSRPKGKVPGETHYGHYFSVWARQPGGVWKVALDIGTGHDQPGPQAPLALQEDTPVKTASGECPFSRQEAIDTILILETELGNPAELLRRQNLWSALVSDEIRFHRPDKLPFTGGEVVAASLALLIKSISWSPLVVRASESGDFAYTYGSYSFRPGEAEGHPLKEDGFYAHVWVWDPHRGWQLSAIVHSPAG